MTISRNQEIVSIIEGIIENAGEICTDKTMFISSDKILLNPVNGEETRFSVDEYHDSVKEIKISKYVNTDTDFFISKSLAIDSFMMTPFYFITLTLKDETKKYFLLAR